MIGIGIPISHRRTPRMDFTSFSNCLRNVSGLTEFRAASETVRPGEYFPDPLYSAAST